MLYNVIVFLYEPIRNGEHVWSKSKWNLSYVRVPWRKSGRWELVFSAVLLLHVFHNCPWTCDVWLTPCSLRARESDGLPKGRKTRTEEADMKAVS
ncbi:hypothetical protein T265_02494 [Opisthorchis viverrini]|uniref:Uncharacterized protein n=1 Tax=Opisthorchis viverrini TaxID=6198 RepID=A0A074ZYY0_OPIVI|nr:hypothetical protein T265_02494 [Opisthorchis viverrini]KER31167.1 hypothetical protein T265_02494 [Opisthorchis viverrini]